jgi:hypothetical protein
MLKSILRVILRLCITALPRPSQNGRWRRLGGRVRHIPSPFWFPNKINNILIRVGLEHSLWSHLCFNTVTNPRAIRKDILINLKRKLISYYPPPFFEKRILALSATSWKYPGGGLISQTDLKAYFETAESDVRPTWNCLEKAANCPYGSIPVSSHGRGLMVSTLLRVRQISA